MTLSRVRDGPVLTTFGFDRRFRVYDVSDEVNLNV